MNTKPISSGQIIKPVSNWGTEALAQVKFFTPDSDWTWYASEFAGEW